MLTKNRAKRIESLPKPNIVIFFHRFVVFAEMEFESLPFRLAQQNFSTYKPNMRTAKLLRLTVFGSLLMFIVGCQTTTVTPVSKGSSEKISDGAKIYIVTPQDGTYGSINYAGSGNSVAMSFEGEFFKYADSVVVGPHVESTVDALAAAHEKGCDYVVIPKITHWEDRATEWSGRPDKINLVVKVVRVSDGRILRTTDIKGESSWLFPKSGARPQDLLQKPVGQFVAELFLKGE